MTKTKPSAKNNKSEPRARSQPQHRSFRISKKRYKQTTPIPSAITLLKQTYQLLRNNKKPFGLIVFVSMLITLLFVQGIGSFFDISQLKNDVEEFLGEKTSKVGTAAALFSYMIGSAGSGRNEVAGSYQLFLSLVVSLATIWLTRQLLAKEKPNLSDAFYKGMYPLIPFFLILLVIGLQLLPLLLGNFLWSTVLQNGLAVTFAEKFLWTLLFLMLALLSIYMVVSSIFALYIVTLPGMTPFKALRSARELVIHRRIAIFLRIVALPLTIFIFTALILIPLLIFITPAAPLIFLVITSLSIVLFHVYMYLLYRSLL